MPIAMVKIGADAALEPDDQIIVIEAFDEAERRRAHELMTEDWQLISLVRRRADDGAAYTEYHLRAPRPPRPVA